MHSTSPALIFGIGGAVASEASCNDHSGEALVKCLTGMCECVSALGRSLLLRLHSSHHQISLDSLSAKAYIEQPYIRHRPLSASCSWEG